jgi:hypothetical protein
MQRDTHFPQTVEIILPHASAAGPDLTREIIDMPG